MNNDIISEQRLGTSTTSHVLLVRSLATNDIVLMGVSNGNLLEKELVLGSLDENGVPMFPLADHDRLAWLLGELPLSHRRGASVQEKHLRKLFTEPNFNRWFKSWSTPATNIV